MNIDIITPPRATHRAHSLRADAHEAPSTPRARGTELEGLPRTRPASTLSTVRTRKEPPVRLTDDVHAEIFGHLMGTLTLPNTDVFGLASRARLYLKDLNLQFPPHPADRRVFESMERRCKEATAYVTELLSKPCEDAELQIACQLLPWISTGLRSDLVRLQGDAREAGALSLLCQHRGMLPEDEVQKLMNHIGTSGSLTTFRQHRGLEGMFKDTDAPLEPTWVQKQLDRCAGLHNSQFPERFSRHPRVTSLGGYVFPWLAHGSPEARRILINSEFDRTAGRGEPSIHTIIQAWTFLDEVSRRQVIERILALPGAFSGRPLAALATRSADLSPAEREEITQRLEKHPSLSDVCDTYFAMRILGRFTEVDSDLEERLIERALSSEESTVASRLLAISFVVQRDGGLNDSPLHHRLHDIYDQQIQEDKDLTSRHWDSASACMWSALNQDQKTVIRQWVSEGRPAYDPWGLFGHLDKIDPPDRDWLVDLANDAFDTTIRSDESGLTKHYDYLLSHIHLLSPDRRESVLSRMDELAVDVFARLGKITMLMRSVNARRYQPAQLLPQA